MSTTANTEGNPIEPTVRALGQLSPSSQGTGLWRATHFILLLPDEVETLPNQYDEESSFQKAIILTSSP